MVRIGSVFTGEAPVAALAEGVVRPGEAPELRVVTSPGVPRAAVSTPFRLGSLSKAVTTSALLSLAADGRLNLGAAVRDYVDLEGERWTVRVDDLAHHSIGVGFHAKRRQMLGPTSVYGMRTPWRRHPPSRPVLRQAFKPGMAWCYGHVSAALAEQVITRCVDAPFAEWMNDEFLPRCGMSSAAFGRPASNRPAMPGTARVAGRVVRLPDVPAASEGACGLWASLEDMLAYASAIATGGGPGLAPSVCRAQSFPGLPRRPDCPFATAGLRVTYRAGHAFVLHGGNWWGYSAGLLIDRCCATAAACVTSGPSVGAAAARCRERLMPRGHDPLPVSIAGGAPRWELRGCAPYHTFRVTITGSNDGVLYARWGWTRPFAHCGRIERDPRNPSGHCCARSGHARLELIAPDGERVWAATARHRFPVIVELAPAPDSHGVTALASALDGRES